MTVRQNSAVPQAQVSRLPCSAGLLEVALSPSTGTLATAPWPASGIYTLPGVRFPDERLIHAARASSRSPDFAPIRFSLRGGRPQLGKQVLVPDHDGVLPQMNDTGGRAERGLHRPFRHRGVLRAEHDEVHVLGPRVIPGGLVLMIAR